MLTNDQQNVSSSETETGAPQDKLREAASKLLLAGSVGFKSPDPWKAMAGALIYTVGALLEQHLDTEERKK